MKTKAKKSPWVRFILPRNCTSAEATRLINELIAANTAAADKPKAKRQQPTRK
jgi:hypothetical protein